MGGVVARALFTLARFNPRLVSLIITQASPHQAPVLSVDPYILGRKKKKPIDTHTVIIYKMIILLDI